MKRTLLFTICGVMALAFSSCASDEGNYDYTSIAQPDIQGVEETYNMEQGETLEINPTVSLPQGSSDQDYDYMWFIFKTNSAALPDTLSHEKNLKATVNLAPSEYDLIYRITNKQSGLFTQAKANINVANSYSNGLAVLSDVEGYSNLAFINIIDHVTENAYETINGRKGGKGPLGIYYVGGDGTQKMLTISTEDSCYALEPISMKYLCNFNKEMFYFPSKPGKLQGFAIDSWHFTEYVVVDGNVYKRQFWDEKPVIKFNTKMGGDYKASPCMFANDNNEFIYDMKGRRFLFDNYYDWASLVGTPDNAYFDASDMKMDMIWGTCYMPNGEDAEVRAVMRDDEGTVWGISGQKSLTWGDNYEQYVKLNPTAKVKIDKEGAENATCHALSSKDVDFMYFSVGSKIVCISMKTGNLISTYDLGENIDCMQFDTNDSPDVLYVGTSDGSKAAKSGSVYYLKMKSDGSLELQKSFKNICGKVVGFTYK